MKSITIHGIDKEMEKLINERAGRGNRPLLHLYQPLGRNSDSRNLVS